MRLGIIGGSGRVGVELALRFQDSNEIDMISIVRNPIAAGFLEKKH